MSTKAQAILDEIRDLPPAEMRELCRHINRIAAETERSIFQHAPVVDEEFESALNEVTGCSTTGKALQRLLEDRRLDREQDEARLAARKRNRVRV